VSLKTAESVAEALRSSGAEVIEVDVTGPDFEVPGDVFIAMNLIHGTFGEDGQIQAILEQRGIRYTGAGVQTSRVAFDKAAEQGTLHRRWSAHAALADLFARWQRAAGDRLSARRRNHRAKAPASACSASAIIKTSSMQGHRSTRRSSAATTLMEDYVAGKELTVGILGDQVLPVIHIEPVDGFYDMNNKYPWMNGTGKTLYHCPADLEPRSRSACRMPR
jgi:D-alanine-D-alanine ligase